MEKNEINKPCQAGATVNSTRAVSRRILSMDMNTVRLAVATLIAIFAIIVSFAVPVIISQIFIGQVETFAEEMILLFFFSTALLALVFLALPTASGLVSFARDTVLGKKPSLWVMLEAFRDKKGHNRAIALPFVVMLRAIIIFLPLCGGIMNLPFFYANVKTMNLFEIIADSSFILCLTLLAFAVGAYLSSFFYFMPYLMVSEKMGFFKSLAMSVRAALPRQMELTRKTLSECGLLLLSALSLFVLLPLFAVPRMLVSYFVYCNKAFGLNSDLNNNTFRSDYI